MTELTNVVEHYDRLIDENNDPVHDPEPLKEYMDKWDGQVFIDKMHLDKSKNVFEIGVGTGRLAVKVAPLCRKFCGIDISPKTIERAKSNLSEYDNIELICDDFMSFVCEERFDVIYSSLTFMHFKRKGDCIKKIRCLLKNEGIFLLSIDKNQSKFIDTGVRKIDIYPDLPYETESYINVSGLKLSEKFETEFAHIYVCKK